MASACFYRTPPDAPAVRSKQGAEQRTGAATVLLAILAGIFLSTVAPAAALAVEGSYAITAWHTKDGLPSDRVRRLLQDSSGYLWVATFDGLVRFDGVRFRHYHVANAPALPNNLILALFEDRAGRIWLGHETGEISFWEKGRFHTLALEPEWKGSPIDHFAEAEDQTLVVINRRGWVRQVRSLQPGPILRDLQGARISYMVNDNAGHIWMVGAMGVHRYDPSKNACSPIPEIPIKDGIRPQLLRAREGGLWVAGARGIRRWHDGRWTDDTIVTDVRQRTSTNTWIALADGRLAAATLEEGLEIYSRNEAPRKVNRATGLPANHVTALLEDGEGNLWIGAGDQGLCRLRPRLVEMVAPPGGWQDRAVQAVIETRDGAIWAGTEGDGAYRWKNGAWTQYNREARLVSPVVKTLLEDRGQRLWLGFANGGFGEIANERYRRHPAALGMATIFAAYQASDDRIWIGGMPGAVCLDGDRKQPLPESFGSLTRINAFAETPDGILWIASFGNGLGRYEAGILKILGRADGLPSEYIWSLHASRDGALWIGTYDRGLVRHKAGRFALIDASRGLPGNRVGQILEDESGALWIGTNGGIARVPKEELERCADGRSARVAAAVFDQSEGLATLGMAGGFQNTAFRARDGALWFATDAGLARIDPRASPKLPASPRVFIEAVRIDGSEAPVAGPAELRMITVPPGTRRVEIDYTGLSLSAPQRLRFRYRLEGVDREWIEAGALRTAYFGYLRPGDYTFRVGVTPDAGANGTIGEASLHLRMEPFFWETTWFEATAAGAALLLVAGVVFALQRARHRRRLEQIARQQAIERDRTRIAHDLHDEIGSGLTQLSILSHAALAAAAQPEKSASRLRQIQETTTEMTEAIDEIVWAVNPRHDSLESLLAYLGRVVQDFTQRAGLQCHIDVPLDLGPLEVTAEYRHELYLALREALNNVSKHAAASTVWVSVRREGKEYLFRLEDNGRGFAAAETGPTAGRRGGLGRETMQRRLARLGGEFSRADRAGGGAVVEFRVRLRPPPRA